MSQEKEQKPRECLWLLRPTEPSARLHTFTSAIIINVTKPRRDSEQTPCRQAICTSGGNRWRSGSSTASLWTAVIERGRTSCFYKSDSWHLTSILWRERISQRLRKYTRNTVHKPCEHWEDEQSLRWHAAHSGTAESRSTKSFQSFIKQFKHVLLSASSIANVCCFTYFVGIFRIRAQIVTLFEERNKIIREMLNIGSMDPEWEILCAQYTVWMQHNVRVSLYFWCFSCWKFAFNIRSTFKVAYFKKLGHVAFVWVVVGHF